MHMKYSFLDRIKILFLGRINTNIDTNKKLDNNSTSQNISPENSALQTLMLLQKHARLIDFISENVDQYSDEEVGAAARVVHQGCQKILKEYIKITPICDQKEESQVTLSEGFNAAEFKLIGNITGKAPFQGTLVHAGWQVEKFNLPLQNKLNSKQIISPAEVEL